uniref:Peptidase M12B domain-containing protein n=1 Tax=Romanomermis culicivorax TaxID=13658 RepID=A0A915JMY9_ROMCU
MNGLCRLLSVVCLSCLIFALIFKSEFKFGSLHEKASSHLLIHPMIVSCSLPNHILYKVNIFDRLFLLNLTEFDYYDNQYRNHGKFANSILSSNFIVQHFGGNERETFLEQTTLNQSSNNSCLYKGYFYSVDKEDHLVVRGNALLDICRGLNGFFDLNIGYIVIEPLISQLSPHLHVPDGQPHLFYRYSRSSHSAENIFTYEELLKHHDLEQQPDSLLNSTDLLSSDRKINKRSPIGSISHDFTVEVMVVADSYMKRYHGSNLQNYILSLMSIVATVYKHPSLEASINVILVRLVVLDNEKVGPRITNNVQETLRHFCHWQQSLNDKDEYSSNHHDVAILLTRLDMCRAPGKCDTLGLAELGTMCDFERSCTIIEDNGLSAAFTIAHELGHTFNIPHDDEKKCSDYMSLDSFNFHIMAPTLEYNTHPWSWSSCSMNLLHHFLSSEKATCLFNKPVQQMYVDQTSINAAPGLNFSVNQQCQYVFGVNSELCPYMWCYRGECVGIAPHQLESVEGSWSLWQDWSPCSRSCGGGVERSGRDCDSPRPENGGKYCIGIRIRSRSCNLQECPSDSVDFRDAQCSQFNKNHTIPNVASSVQWVPKIVGVQRKDMCKLLCSLEHRPEFYVLKPKVIDGTSCGTDFDGICIDGICEDAGCDGILGSPLLRDSCGVCGGDDSSCRLITNSFNGKTSYGYNLVGILPMGASKLEIRQTSWNGRSDDDNYLVLITGKGKFLLNGHFQVSVFPQQVRFGDILIAYSGSGNVVEKINFTKPLKEQLKLYVLSVGQLKSPNITWQYLISEASTVSKYEWRYSTDWTECNSTCNGSKEKRIICVDSSSNKLVKDSSCFNIPALTKQLEACNINCKLRWAVKSSSTCSVSCGSGLKTYIFSCITENFLGYHADEIEVDDAHCQDIPKPPEAITCYADCSGFNWVYSNWTECSSSCGIGVQVRKVYCAGDTNRSIDRTYCEHLPVGVLEKTCQNLECPSWKYSAWSECSRTCDTGVQMRSALCKSINGEELKDNLCDLGSKNDTYRSCNAELCTKWTTAVCTDSRGQNVDDSKCSIIEKITSKTCARSPCPSLLIGEWSTNANAHQIRIPMPGHTVAQNEWERVKKDIELIDELIQTHDVCFLLFDSRESRWLPAALGSLREKFVISAALGFDSYLIVRHGAGKLLSAPLSHNPPYLTGDALGCYFCSDVTAPSDTLSDRTLDQQCTVTRPGASFMASGLAVELMITTLQHPEKHFAPALCKKSRLRDRNDSDEDDDQFEHRMESCLGHVPHQIRGFLSRFEQFTPSVFRFGNCICCSRLVTEKLASDDKFEFLLNVFNDSSTLEKMTGLEKLMNEENLDDLIAVSSGDES